LFEGDGEADEDQEHRDRGKEKHFSSGKASYDDGSNTCTDETPTLVRHFCLLACPYSGDYLDLLLIRVLAYVVLYPIIVRRVER